MSSGHGRPRTFTRAPSSGLRRPLTALRVTIGQVIPHSLPDATGPGGAALDIFLTHDSDVIHSSGQEFQFNTGRVLRIPGQDHGFLDARAGRDEAVAAH